MFRCQRRTSTTEMLSLETRTLLVLLALRCRFQGIQDYGIADYHRGLRRLFDHCISYGNCWKGLQKLGDQGLLRKGLIRAVARNDIVDRTGEVKVSRTTRVYKRTFTPNLKSRALKGMLKRLCKLSKEALGKDMAQVFSNDKEIEKLSIRLRTCPSNT